jgi:hypothetical protein
LNDAVSDEANYGEHDDHDEKDDERDQAVCHGSILNGKKVVLILALILSRTLES